MHLEMQSIGTVEASRREAEDDFWGEDQARIRLNEAFSPEALQGLAEFSHVEVLYFFHQVEPEKIVVGARHPRSNPAWPRVGIFAQRGKNRPNRIGSTICKVVQVEGNSLVVSELDAIDGTPVLDLKPVMAEFLPRGEVRQPPWSHELMKEYWLPSRKREEPEEGILRSTDMSRLHRPVALRASCLCQGIAFEIDGSIRDMLFCHCSMCRKAHGTAFRARGRVRTDDLRWVRGEELVRFYESSPGESRGFCSVCGSNIFTKFAARPQELGIALGILDDDPGNRPTCHLFVGSKAPWFEITDSLPQHDAFPPGYATPPSRSRVGDA